MELTPQEQRFEAALDAKFGPATGDPLKDFTRNLIRLSVGVATVEEVGRPFYRAEDGSLGVYAEGTPFEEIVRAAT